MPITISCPSCRRQLRVPDDLLGKTVRCPGCQSTFTAEDPDAVADVDVIEEEETPRRPARGTKPPRTEGEEIEAEGRSARRRRRREEEDEEADYREYEDDLEDDRARRRRRRSAAKRRAAEALAGPAIALIITGGLGLATFILDIVARIALGTAITSGLLGKGNLGAAAGEKANELLYGIIVDLIFLIFPGIVVTGAVKLKNVSSYGYGLTAAIIAMLPCSGCCLLGLPFGIWALVVMHRDEVRRAFG